ncbi:hypothetical protein phytr_620 [Candidatus Phycorickettsia trachydisci]|uniref:Uncharacterized protein n=1 Tax=Candidatus Phycorickettsia trachydisci TaxID=2115978 RepID=A0A2P1P6Z9_9RICK|nr:hypothetical protein [Candidatus Phycorickettsia trachydisci]AVP87025.1 hypothetical protein phytr_620 [Candidatus Phycorickettsia trachydisci]
MEDLWHKVTGFIMYHDFEGFRQLVEQENMVQSKNENDNTLLHLVGYSVNAQGGDEWDNYNSFITYLLDKKVDVNAKNNKGETALDLSLRHGASAETKLLLIHGAQAGNMNIEQLSSLLFSVSYQLIDYPEDYNLNEKVKLICGALDAYNKVKSTYPEELAEAFSRSGEGSIREYKGIIDSHVHELMQDIESHSPTEEKLELSERLRTNFHFDDDNLVDQLGSTSIVGDPDGTVLD